MCQYIEVLILSQALHQDYRVHMLNDTIVVLFNITFYSHKTNGGRIAMFQSAWTNWVLFIQDPKKWEIFTWTSSIGVVTVVRSTWYKNFNIMKLHCDTNIEKISAISTLAEHLIFSKGMLSIKEKFILMKVITASSKCCNKVCEQFEQCMSKCRAGV